MNHTIEDYLDRLKNLEGTEIKVSYVDVGYFQDFEKNTDGSYTTVVTIYQKFERFLDSKLIYFDITSKTIEVRLELKEDKFINDKKWKLLFGDVKVIETVKKMEDFKY